MKKAKAKEEATNTQISGKLLKSALSKGIIDDKTGFDFGFIPSTLAGDGDPLDILVLMDEPAFPGCLVHAKVLGVLKAEQIQEGKTVRNDRIIGIHNHSVRFSELNSWKDIPPSIRNQYELFFNVNAMCKGRVFDLLGWRDSSEAFKVIESAVKAGAKN